MQNLEYRDRLSTCGGHFLVLSGLKPRDDQESQKGQNLEPPNLSLEEVVVGQSTEDQVQRSQEGDSNPIDPPPDICQGQSSTEHQDPAMDHQSRDPCQEKKEEVDVS